MSSSIVVLALTGKASKVHRPSILSAITSSGVNILAESSLKISLPEDDDLLRSFLAHEIETQGEAGALIAWAVKFTSNSNYCIVIERDLRAPSHFENLLGRLQDRFGKDDFYLSPHPDVAQMQARLIFPELSLQADQYEVEERLEGMHISHDMEPTASSGGSGFSEISSASASTAATSIAPAKTMVSNDSKTFRARPIPGSLAKPTIQPRLSKAAALRMGVQLEQPQRPSPASASDNKVDQGPVGISGLARSDVKLPASLKAPSIAPRLNKAATARLNPNADDVSSPARPAPSAGAGAGVTGRERKEVDFSNVPGHKRQSVIAVSSTAAPLIAPRLNKAAAARLNPTGSLDSPLRPSSSASNRERKHVDYSNVPGHKRMSRISVSSTAAPSIAPRQNRASMSRIQSQSQSQAEAHAIASPATTNRAIKGRASSTASLDTCRSVGASRPSTGTDSPILAAGRERRPVDFANVPGHKRQSLSLKIASLSAPSVAPRQNRASLARTNPGGVPLPPSSASAEKENNVGAQATPTNFSHVPGHKRHSLSFNLSSLQAPAIQPRLNKAADARLANRPAGSSKSVSANNSPVGKHKSLPGRSHPPTSFRL